METNNTTTNTTTNTANTANPTTNTANTATPETKKTEVQYAPDFKLQNTTTTTPESVKNNVVVNEPAKKESGVEFVTAGEKKRAFERAQMVIGSVIKATHGIIQNSKNAKLNGDSYIRLQIIAYSIEKQKYIKIFISIIRQFFDEKDVFDFAVKLIKEDKMNGVYLKVRGLTYRQPFLMQDMEKKTPYLNEDGTLRKWNKISMAPKFQNSLVFLADKFGEWKERDEAIAPLTRNSYNSIVYDKPEINSKKIEVKGDASGWDAS